MGTYRIKSIEKKIRKKRKKKPLFARGKFQYIKIGKPVMVLRGTPMCCDLHYVRVFRIPFDFKFYIADDSLHGQSKNKIPLVFFKELIPPRDKIKPMTKNNLFWVRYDIVNSLSRLSERRHLV